MRLATAVSLLLILAASAQASTVRVGLRKPPPSAYTSATSTLRFAAAPGERNRVVIRMQGVSRRMLVTDNGARLHAGRGCRALGRHRARCVYDRRSDQELRIFLGDRGDSGRCAAPRCVMSGGPGPDHLSGGANPDVIDGGRGDDVLRGRRSGDHLTDGPGRDVVHGGSGHDVLRSTDTTNPVRDDLDGGPGPDAVTYRSRHLPVVARIGGTGGVRGEHDRLASVETIVGGRADDVLRGSAGDDGLQGGAGADRLFGFGGNDDLDSGFGPGDRLAGGSGDDFLASDRAALRCGPGRDRVGVGGNGGSRLQPDCERITDYSVAPARVARVAPLRVTRTAVTMRLPCAKEDTPGLRRVRLVAHGVTLAEGTRPYYVLAGGYGVTCRARLAVLRPALVAAGPVMVALRYRDIPRWSFVLRP